MLWSKLVISAALINLSYTSLMFLQLLLIKTHMSSVQHKVMKQTYYCITAVKHLSHIYTKDPADLLQEPLTHKPAPKISLDTQQTCERVTTPETHPDPVSAGLWSAQSSVTLRSSASDTLHCTNCVCRTSRAITPHTASVLKPARPFSLF